MMILSHKGFIGKWGVWIGIVVCLVGYSVLNRGFAYIGSYPVFIGEIVLIFYIIILNHKLEFPRFITSQAGLCWLIFLLINIGIFLYSASQNLSESIRNSVYWVYTLYFYIGFVFAAALTRRGMVDDFEKILSLTAKLVIIYYALYPMKDALREGTQVLSGGSVSLVGYYSSLHAVAVSLVFYLLYRSTNSFSGRIWFGLGLSFIVAFSQARAAILAVMAIVLFLVFFRSQARETRDSIRVLLVLGLIGLGASLLGWSVEGERGGFDGQFLLNMVSSIFSETDSESFNGSRIDRLIWWEDVIARVFSDYPTLFLGLGHDEILIDREIADGVIIRYPHNSFVSILGFSGIVGLASFLLMLFSVLKRVFRYIGRPGISVIVEWYPVLFISYFVAAFFSTVFEAPFHSYIFWLVSGFAYRLTFSPLKEEMK